MTQHYVLTLNPYSQYEWEKCSLRNPITGEVPDLTNLIAETVAREPGTYLVAVKIEIQVLQQASVTPLAA